LAPSETSYRSFNRLVADDFIISQPKEDLHNSVLIPLA
jgi:hypothetical protein